MAERILIASGKGGVGKSTVCLGLAAGLAAMGKCVLILEADTGFRGLDISLSMENNALYDLSDLLEGRSSIEETLLRHRRSGVELICAPNNPEYLPDSDRLETLLTQLESRSDYIIIDCGAGFGPVQGRFAALSTMALLVTVPDKVTVRSAAHLSLLLQGKGLKNQRLIINGVPRKLPPSDAIDDLDDVIDLVGVQLIGAIPEGDFHGMPQREDSPAAEELFRIAERLTGQQRELVLYR